MKKIKVKLSDAKKKVGKTNWSLLKSPDTNKSNNKIKSTQKGARLI